MYDVVYRGASENTGPSPAIWADCPTADIIAYPGRGMHFFDDFENFSQHITDQDTQKYASYIDTGVTAKQLGGVAAVNHVIEIAGNDADNDEFVLATHGPLAEVSDTAGNERKLWFEARFYTPDDLAANKWGMFIGLGYDFGGAAPLSKTLCLTDDDSALGACSFLGFHCDQAAPTARDCVYKADGQTAQVNIAGVKTLVASTWYRVGFVFDPSKPTANRIRHQEIRL